MGLSGAATVTVHVRRTSFFLRSFSSLRFLSRSTVAHHTQSGTPSRLNDDTSLHTLFLRGVDAECRLLTLDGWTST